MNQAEKRLYLLKALLAEQPRYRNIAIPTDAEEQKRLLRSLLNVRLPSPVSDEFLRVEGEYLEEAIKEKGITDWQTLTPIQTGIYLWRGDITTLRCDGIVNAANSGMLGCFYPCHGCIDNAIHTYAGVELRAECDRLMRIQGHEEETGSAKLTPGYHLPAKYVIHTVGPIVQGKLTPRHEELLASCYRSCLARAEEASLHSIAFCCISTGEFGFPQKRAAEIAVKAVKEFQTHNSIEVIFNVFKKTDEEIYRELLG